MSRNRKMDFAAGIQDGIPICLGYIAVSFTFGIMAKMQDFPLGKLF